MGPDAVTHLAYLAVEQAAADDGLLTWAGVVNSLVGTALTGFTLIGLLYKWFRSLTRGADGRTIVQHVEEQGRQLTSNSETLDKLVTDVREMRTHQSGLNSRVESIERRLDRPPRSSPWRR